MRGLGHRPINHFLDSRYPRSLGSRKACHRSPDITRLHIRLQTGQLKTGTGTRYGSMPRLDLGYWTDIQAMHPLDTGAMFDNADARDQGVVYYRYPPLAYHDFGFSLLCFGLQTCMRLQMHSQSSPIPIQPESEPNAAFTQPSKGGRRSRSSRVVSCLTPQTCTQYMYLDLQLQE